MTAKQAVKNAMGKQQKIEDREEKQEKQQEQFGEYLHKKREKSEWKAV
jgi:hypothetical protein